MAAKGPRLMNDLTRLVGTELCFDTMVHPFREMFLGRVNDARCSPMSAQLRRFSVSPYESSGARMSWQES